MRQNPGSPQALAPPCESQRSSLQNLLRGQGATGLVFFCLLVAGAGAFLWYLGNYACETFSAYADRSANNFKASETIIASTRVIVLLPLVPTILVAVFLPLRLAWIHGRVTWAALIDEVGDAFHRALYTLQFTWRQLLLMSIPLIALAIFVHELELAHQAIEIVVFVQIAATGFGLAILWQAVAALCAAPIAILAQSEPFTAARESGLIVRGSHRLHILCSLFLIIGLAFTAEYLTATLSLVPEELWGIRAVAVILLWVLLTNIGRHCLIATVAYLERIQLIEQQVVADHAAQMNINGITTTLPNGQPVTIHIQHLHVDPRK